MSRAAEIYALRTTPEGFRIDKLDEDYNPIRFYSLTQRRGWIRCQCWQANKETCRHRQMVALFQQTNRLNKGWLFNYTTGQWIKPMKQ